MPVLIVEDEIMVAMLVEDLLTDLGCDVTGPAVSAETAVEAARREIVDFALLDVNLDGGTSFAAADILRARGVPFAFVTGYEADTVDERFSKVPVLQKPIERQMLQRLFVPNAGAATPFFGRAKAQAHN